LSFQADVGRGKVLDFIFIGPDKSGSTWLYERLREHPQVALPPAKELFYFDRYYHLGPDWLQRQFANARPGQRRGEISHDYLFSEVSMERIARDAPDAVLLVTLREPIERAVSAYHYMKLQGRIPLSVSIDAALASVSELIGHGRYGAHLSMVFDHVPAEKVVVLLYDELRQDPQRFFDRVCAALSVSPLLLSEEQRSPVLGRRSARVPGLIRTLRGVGAVLRRYGLHSVVGRAKDAALGSALLFRTTQQGTVAGRPTPALVASLREELRPDIARAQELTKLPLLELWAYETAVEEAS
jgi:hypothetical protein